MIEPCVLFEMDDRIKPIVWVKLAIGIDLIVGAELDV